MFKKKTKLFFALFLSLIIVLFFYKGLFGEAFFDSDDYEHHAVRTANYYLALKQGQFPVRWGPNLNDGYGYPSFNYTYHLPYIFSTLFHVFGFSIQSSVNLSMLFAVLFSASSAFFLMHYLTKSKKYALLAPLIYTLNPYFLLNVFWRGAIGEVYFIAFVPLLFLGNSLIFSAKKMREKYLAWFLSVFSLLAMILNHVPSILLLALVMGPYLVFKIIKNFKKKKVYKKQIILLIVSSYLLAMFLSAWYWIPAFFEKNYISYDSGRSLSQYSDNFIKLGSLLSFNRQIWTSARFDEVIQLGLAIFFIFALATCSLFFKNKKENKELALFLILFLILMFFTQSISKSLWENSQILQMIQYPWRILWLNAFISLYLLAILFKKTNKKFQYLLFLISLSLIIFSGFSYSKRRQMEVKSDHDWLQMPTTGTSFDEHRPIWSNKPYVFGEEILILPASQESFLAEIKDEEVEELKEFSNSFTNYEIEIREINGTRMSYWINTPEEVIAIHKRLYFPGWSTTIDGLETEVLQDVAHYQGVLVIKIPTGEHQVLLEFSGETELRRLAETISLLAILSSMIMATYLFLLKKNNL